MPNPSFKQAQASGHSVVIHGNVRITVLTSRLFRIEYSSDKKFEDRPTQIILKRQFPEVNMEINKTTSSLEIITDSLKLQYLNTNIEPLPSNLIISEINEEFIWHPKKKNVDNLKGTARTLDEADGRISLENGLISRAGWSIIDDSSSLIFTEEGWIEPREKLKFDIYFFGYGIAYQDCLDDYLKLSGNVPLLPRWIFGNWWSRYWKYSQTEVEQLVKDFRSYDIPLSIFIIDMDWHITDLKNYWKELKQQKKIPEKLQPAIHDGWTGFTWNEKLFPNYKKLLEFLKSNNVRTALNLHPAKGIYPHEIQYSKISQRLGLDPSKFKAIEFDIANQEFAKVYFEEVLHPYQMDGIDFWWIDWQQGKKTKMSGLDPLWWLNHLHFEDLSIDLERRPFVFSRWGGLGNQRYPIGFSGDTYITWRSLSFQPHFTSTAANVGYFWWSHDIGGHMGGAEDAELYTRWIQYGCFSPILRLHSTKNPFMEKLPWKFDSETFSIVKSTLQLRHQLIPYIYSIAWLSYTKNIPLCQPMYYRYPSNESSYSFKDQYFFGTELLIAPIISPMDPTVGLSRKEIWLPNGLWFDFNSGECIDGDQVFVNYYFKDEIPIFAKAGAIIPVSPAYHEAHHSNPGLIQLLVFPGSDNQFILYEDDGVSQKYLAGNHVQTEINLTSSQKSLTLEICPSQGNLCIIPKERKFEIIIKGIIEPKSIHFEINDSKGEINWTFDKSTRTLSIEPILLQPNQKLQCHISHSKGIINEESKIEDKLYSLLKAMQIPYNLKSDLYEIRDKLIADVHLLHESLRIFSNLPKNIDSSHNYNTVIQLIAYAFILSAVQPKLLETSKLKNMLSKTPENELKRLVENFSLLYSGSTNKADIFPLTKPQLQAIIEILTQQSLKF
jgi:alpha-glucosidase (family GH31 glycosyl hydrolase)